MTKPLVLAKLWRFFADRRGSAAVEFAFIVPVLLSLYFVTMEVSQGVDTSRKVSRVASQTADLITQQGTIVKADIDAIMQIGGATLQPYNRSLPKIIVTAINISTDATPKVTVAWSRKLVAGIASKDVNTGTTTTVPATLMAPGSFLIRVETDLAYKPVVTWSATQKTSLGLTSAFDNIDMAETYYLRPRMSSTIPCSDCG